MQRKARVLPVLQLLWQAQLSDPSELSRWPSSRLMNSERAEREKRTGILLFFFHGLTSGGNLVQQPCLLSACRCPGEMVAFKKKKIKVNRVCAEPVLRHVLHRGNRQLLAPALKGWCFDFGLGLHQKWNPTAVFRSQKERRVSQLSLGFYYFLNTLFILHLSSL